MHIRSIPPWAPALALTAIGVVAITLWRPPPPEIEPAEAPREVVLTLRCVRPERAPVVLAPHITCPPGAALQIAARFAEPPQTVTLEVLGGSQPERVDLHVAAKPGEEWLLPHPVPLTLPGTRQVVLTAGPFVLRESVRVEPDR